MARHIVFISTKMYEFKFYIIGWAEFNFFMKRDSFHIKLMPYNSIRFSLSFAEAGNIKEAINYKYGLTVPVSWCRDASCNLSVYLLYGKKLGFKTGMIRPKSCHHRQSSLTGKYLGKLSSVKRCIRTNPLKPFLYIF